jgi:NodT family efflux transporter outer membrane factor (OMF) lipoprotein
MNALSAALRRLSPVVLLFCLQGCAAQLHTPYQTPELTLPPSWQQQTEATVRLQGRWWERFGDPTLNSLVDEALRRNNDLAAAAILVRKAQLQAELADSEQLPSLTVQGSGALSRNLGSDSGETRSLSTTGAVSYELDLWGRLSRTADAARWEAHATEEDRASTALSLIGTTASTYWQLGYLNQRILLSLESIAYAKKTLELVRVQKAAGAASALEILEAERNLTSQEASHTTLIQQRMEARNALAILFDGPPRLLKNSEPSDLSGALLPRVDSGLPAELLARRPDLRAAESRLRSALATTDATRADFYPSINLSGTLGGSSEELSRLLSNPIGTLTADLALPFVQWRDMQRTIKISEAEYQQTVVTFRQTLYSAMTDVENNLSARQQYLVQAEKLQQTLDAARQAEELYRIRYRAGGSPLTSWLDAQENRRQAEISLAENRLNQLNTYITLCKALGGDLEQSPQNNMDR